MPRKVAGTTSEAFPRPRENRIEHESAVYDPDDALKDERERELRQREMRFAWLKEDFTEYLNLGKSILSQFANDKEIWTLLAKCSKGYFDALVKAGFTEEQALTLVVQTTSLIRKP